MGAWLVRQVYAGKFGKVILKSTIIGAVCRDAIFVNRSEKILSKDYNTNVQSLLRNPKLDLLIVEYDEDILETEGMFYYGSNMVVLDNPSETEMTLARDIFDDSTVIVKEENKISIHRKGLLEQYTLEEDEPFTRVYLKEIGTVVWQLTAIAYHYIPL